MEKVKRRREGGKKGEIDREKEAKRDGKRVMKCGRTWGIEIERSDRIQV